MQLTLRNFRCHLSYTLDLPDKGLVLLSGPSGAGKSSLLQALYWVLYADVKKPYTFGTKTCSVTCEWKGVSIRRQARPAKLTVTLTNGEQKEDDEAQTYIHQLIGLNQHEFMASSYIRQKMRASILALTPASQLVFIEKLAFDEQELGDIKTKIKEQIKKREMDLEKVRTELEFAKREAEQIQVPERMECPVNDIKAWRESIREKSRIIRQLQNRESECKSNLTILNTLRKTYRQLMNEKKSYQAEEKVLQEKLQVLGLPWVSGDNEKDSLNKLDMLQARLQFIKDALTLREEQTRLERLMREEEKTLQQRIVLEKTKVLSPKERNRIIQERDCLKMKLQKVRERNAVYNELEQVRHACKGDPRRDEARFVDSLSELETKILELREQLAQYRLKREIKQCPNCKSSLRLTEDGHLECVHTKTSSIGTLKSTVTEPKLQKKLQSLLSQKESIQLKLREVQKQKTQIEMLEEKLAAIHLSNENKDNDESHIVSHLSQLEKRLRDDATRLERIMADEQKAKQDPYSPSLKSLCKSVRERIDQLEKRRKDERIEDDDNPTDIEDQIRVLRNYIRQQQELQSKHDELYNKLIMNQEHIKRLEENIQETKDKAKEIGVIRVLEKELEDVRGEIKVNLHEYDELVALEDTVNAYVEYRRVLKEKKRWQNKATRLALSEKHKSSLLSASLRLREKSQVAEALTITRTIDGINEASKLFLDRMFVDPISVRLEAFKMSKGSASSYSQTKPKLNLNIIYQNREYDTLDSLSGGEQDRVSASFLFGLNTMLSSPIILLDEVFSSLDADTNNEIIASLRDLAKHKLIVVVAHQTTEGIFDKVIRI